MIKFLLLLLLLLQLQLVLHLNKDGKYFSAGHFHPWPSLEQDNHEREFLPGCLNSLVSSCVLKCNSGRPSYVLTMQSGGREAISARPSTNGFHSSCDRKINMILFQCRVREYQISLNNVHVLSPRDFIRSNIKCYREPILHIERGWENRNITNSIKLWYWGQERNGALETRTIILIGRSLTQAGPRLVWYNTVMIHH